MPRLCSLPLVLLLAGCAAPPAPPTPASVQAEPLAAPRPGPVEPALLAESEGRRILLRLQQANGEQRLWRSPDGLVLATNGARVVASAGGAVWLAATRFDTPDPLDDPAALLGRRAEARRLVDLASASRDPAEMRFGVVVECRLSAEPVIEQGENAILVTETCEGTGQRFPNRFWADARDGRIIRSEQWAGGAQPVSLRVVSAE
ncbi:MAG: YjbF family lipoprotein [Acetobacteraceae bacterium]|nr:YjbF family lipoprotein [Acetobacteraceae bacterium]MDW8398104.1 YjbF family lipoprotein [Acetobacteraceae bacterium]